LGLPYSRTKQEVTREKFARFLEWLSSDPNKAGEEYELLRFRLLNFFTNRHCGFVDELADETINRVMLKVSEEQIENKVAYCYGVAKNVYRETLRKQRLHVDLDDVVVPAAAPYEPSVSSECLDKCLEELPEENRQLLIDYFGATQQKVEFHRSLAARLKTTQTALRMRVFRYKKSLSACVQECMEGFC
jgi:DNA-directed RNA polymerase specialized sigma24 family protein